MKNNRHELRIFPRIEKVSICTRLIVTHRSANVADDILVVLDPKTFDASNGLVHL